MSPLSIPSPLSSKRARGGISKDDQLQSFARPMVRSVSSQTPNDVYSRKSAPSDVLTTKAMATFVDARAIDENIPLPDHLLRKMHLAVGINGSSRSIKELQHAFESLRLDVELALGITGATARCLAQSDQVASMMPESWQLLLVVGDPKQGVKKKQLESTSQSLHNKLTSRGFLVANKSPTELYLKEGKGIALATIRVVPADNITWPGALACEQMYFDLIKQQWRPLTHVDPELAKQYMKAGLWREPKPFAAPEPVAINEAMSALQQSWHHQALGYSPSAAIDPADFAALSSVERHFAKARSKGQKSAERLAVQLVHSFIASDLCDAQSTTRRQQLRVAAAGLMQLRLAFGANNGRASDHPLARALDNFLVAQCPEHDEIVQCDVTLCRMVAHRVPCSFWMQFFAQKLAQRSVLVHVPETLVRITLPGFLGHIFVPPLDENTLPEPKKVALSRVFRESKTDAQAISMLLGHLHLPEELQAFGPLTKNILTTWAYACIALQKSMATSWGTAARGQTIACAAVMSPRSVECLPATAVACLPLDDLVAAWLQPCMASSSDAALNALYKLQQRHTSLAARIEIVQRLTTDEQGRFFTKLCQCGQQDEAIEMLQHNPEILHHLKEDTLYEVVKAATTRKHLFAPSLISHFVKRHSQSERLLEDELLTQACEHSHALQPIADLLRRRLHTNPSDPQALRGHRYWLMAIMRQQAYPHLKNYLVASPIDCPTFAKTCKILTSFVKRSKDESLMQAAVDAWDRLAKLNDKVALTEWLHLRSLQLFFGVKPEEEERGKLFTAWVRLMLSEASPEHKARASLFLAAIPDALSNTSIFILALNNLSAESLRHALGSHWRQQLQQALHGNWKDESKLSEAGIFAFQTLWKQFCSNSSDWSAEYSRAVWQAANLMVVHNRPRVAFDILCDAVRSADAMHTLLELLGRDPTAVLANHMQWKRVAAVAELAFPSHRIYPTHANRILLVAVFWAQFCDIVSSHLLSIEVNEGSIDPILSRLQRVSLATHLMFMRNTISPFDRGDSLLTLLTEATKPPTINAQIMAMLKVRHNQVKGSQVMSPFGPQFNNRGVLIQHAVLKALPLDERRGANLRTLLNHFVNVNLNEHSEHLLTDNDLQNLWDLINFSDLWLDDADQDTSVINSRLRSLACALMDAPFFSQRLQLLSSISKNYCMEDDDAPRAAIINRLVGDIDKRKLMAPAARREHDDAMLNLICSMQYVLPRGDHFESMLVSTLLRRVTIGTEADAEIYVSLADQFQDELDLAASMMKRPRSKLTKEFFFPIAEEDALAPSNLGLASNGPEKLAIAIGNSYSEDHRLRSWDLKKIINSFLLATDLPVSNDAIAHHRVYALRCRETQFYGELCAHSAVLFASSGSENISKSFNDWFLICTGYGKRMNAAALGVALAIGESTSNTISRMSANVDHQCRLQAEELRDFILDKRLEIAALPKGEASTQQLKIKLTQICRAIELACEDSIEGLQGSTGSNGHGTRAVA